MSQTIARESMMASILTYIGVGIGFATTFFVQTSYFTPEQIGLLRLLVEVATLMAGSCMLGLSTSISRYFPYFRSHPIVTIEEGRRLVNRGFLGYIVRVAAVGTLAFLPLYAVFHEQIEGLFVRRSALFVEYYWMVPPLVVFIVLWTITELYSIQLLRMSVPKGIRELLLRVLLLLAYLAFALGWCGFDRLVLLSILSYGMCMLASLWYLSRLVPLSLSRSRHFPGPQLRKDFRRYTLLALLSTVGTTLAGRMDLLMLAFVDRDGLASAAIFSIAFFMVSIIEVPTRALISIGTAKLSDLMKRGDMPSVERLYKQVSFYQLLFGLLLFLLIWVNIDNIFAIMPNGEVFAEGKYVFFILGLSKLIEITFTASHPIVSASRHYHWSLYYTLWLCAISFVSNLFLIPLWGPIGASLATLITVCVGYALQQGLLSYHYHVHPLSPRMWSLLALPLAMLSASQLLPSMDNPWIDLPLRTSAVGIVALGCLLTMNITPELKNFISERWSRQR